ncbi:MAG: outer membrane beta-barrel protein [Cyclobacteriaceae bacterium]
MGLICTTGYSQLLVGPVVGGGFSWVSFHEKESRQFYKQTPMPSFSAGLGISFQVRKNLFMHTALLYTKKGQNLTSDQSPDLKQKEIYHFIEAPVIFTREFKIRFGENKIVKWYAGMGPNISYWLDGKISLMTTQQREDGVPVRNYQIDFNRSNNPDASKVYLPDANRVQMGLIFSTGWVFEPVGMQKIHLNVRYEVGGTYLSKTGLESFAGINDYHGDLKARMMSLRLTASYLIDLKPSERKKGKSTSTIARKHK